MGSRSFSTGNCLRVSLQEPTAADAINGTWKLLYTSRPGTSSPIQRTFTGVEAFTVLQEVFLQDDVARINNCVDFGEKAGAGLCRLV